MGPMVINADTVAPANSYVIADVSAGDVVVKLPPSPGDGDFVDAVTFDPSKTGRQVGIDGNGKNVCAPGTGIVASFAGGTFFGSYHWVYSAVLGMWTAGFVS